MNTKSTETAQNIIGRLSKEISLEGSFNDSSPKSILVKHKMLKVRVTLLQLLGQLDELNTIKENN